MMSHVLALFAALALQADEMPRNPFWPHDYEGTRYPITTEPRVKPKPKVTTSAAVRKNPTAAAMRAQADAAAKAEAKAKEAARIAEENRLWNMARKSLRFGGMMGFNSTGGQSAAITINDRIYATGDLVSTNCGDFRFTWKIEDITPDGKIKLRRIKYISLKREPSK